ncbi:MAG: hypothetical protein AMJ60_11590 [Desulfobacterales bacterium SG8_35]|nr:MAG: hypothetical protein AMJ60_11590 [Desulfobacterales bacterium SG8_35]
MSTGAFVTQLKQAGVRLWVVGDKLRCKGPETALTEEVVIHLQEIKPEVMRLLAGDKRSQPQKAKGYGCAGCGNKIYQAVTVWEMLNLPETAEFKYEHKPTTHWQCEKCRVIYEIIGGTRGPVLIQ